MDLKEKTVRPRGTDSARLVTLIETRAIQGYGTDDDPVRTKTQYWDFDGTLVAEIDSDDRPRKKTHQWELMNLRMIEE